VADLQPRRALTPQYAVETVKLSGLLVSDDAECRSDGPLLWPKDRPGQQHLCVTLLACEEEWRKRCEHRKDRDL
jgi:hypothetical protein